jgi:hypothetical protein
MSAITLMQGLQPEAYLPSMAVLEAECGKRCAFSKRVA